MADERLTAGFAGMMNFTQNANANDDASQQNFWDSSTHQEPAPATPTFQRVRPPVSPTRRHFDSVTASVATGVEVPGITGESGYGGGLPELPVTLFDRLMKASGGTQMVTLFELVENPGKLVCCGVIGSTKERFCLRIVEEGKNRCSVAGHVKKPLLTVGHSFIKAPTSGKSAISGFINPSVDTAMAKKKLGSFYEESCTGKEWNSVFASLEDMLPLNNDADIEDFKASINFDVPRGMTPFKCKQETYEAVVASAAKTRVPGWDMMSKTELLE